MEEFDSIEKLANAVKRKLDQSQKKKILALYAFNSTGKTRLSNIIEETENEEDNENLKVLCYNVFLEDMFGWDNENYILTFNTNSWTVKLIIDQGLENDIINNFKDIVDSNIEPAFDFDRGEVFFNIASGDSASATNIKISKSEESVFIWSFFYTILKAATDVLNTNENDRSTTIFNNLKYIIIDDPVSSIDDTKIVAIATRLSETIKLPTNVPLKYLITTHHALFYNVLANSFDSRNTRDYSFKKLNLLKDNYVLKLSEQGDTPFSYHLLVKQIIENAINDNDIKKYHFNLFRNLLEKTSTFLGYKNWVDCIIGSNKSVFIRLLNLYSHSRLSDLESSELSYEDKSIFIETYNDFIKNFRWE